MSHIYLFYYTICILQYFITYIRDTYHIDIQWGCALGYGWYVVKDWVLMGSTVFMTLLCYTIYMSYAMPLLLRCLWISRYVIYYILYAVSHICYSYLNRVCPIVYAIYCISCHELYVPIPVFLPGSGPVASCVDQWPSSRLPATAAASLGFPEDWSD